MARPKKVTAPAVAPVEATETVKEITTAAPAEEKKAAEVKKPAAKKPAAKTAAKTTTAAKKTTTVVENIFIQQNGKEVTTAELVERAKAESGVKSLKNIDVYVRPEINMVYYVIDGDKFGNFEIC